MHRVTHLVANLGWVDLDAGSSPGWWRFRALNDGHGRTLYIVQGDPSPRGLGWVDLGCSTVLLGQHQLY